MQDRSFRSHIFARTLTGSTVTLAVEPTDATEVVFAKFSEKLGVPTYSFRLVFAGKQPHDSLS
jgi:hypothetical protein